MLKTLYLSILFFPLFSWSFSLEHLQKSYPWFTMGADQNTAYFSNGSILLWDDGAPSDVENQFDQILEKTTNLSQMFLIPYIPGHYGAPQLNEDPGRIRLDQFFLNIYGNNPKAIEADLVPVHWIDGTVVRFNRRFGAAAALQKVSDELRALLVQNPSLLEYLESPIGGTYFWRPIAGTRRLSVHSFGVALDINLRKVDYWYKDQQAGKPYQYRNRIPLDIVRVFEKHRFIWGGKWYHYDTMHFEYRPELF